jgi:hypothetical protein
MKPTRTLSFAPSTDRRLNAVDAAAAAAVRTKPLRVKLLGIANILLSPHAIVYLAA